MTYIESIILYCLQQLNGERTIYSIYHLLKGKKSSQTIQDAHLYELTKYFGVYQAITRESLEEAVKRASIHNWITPCAEQHFILTENGKMKLRNFDSNINDLPYLDGWKYHKMDLQFWERMSMLVQVVSNLIRHETHYIPIQKNKQTHYWVKAFLNKSIVPRNLLGTTLFSEIVECLEKTNHLDPSVLTLRLTGYKRIGLTPIQAAEKLKMDFSRYHLEFINILHYFIQHVTSSSIRYPLLSSILGNPTHNMMLTKSTRATFELLKQGFSIEEISTSRQLKTSTIEDHIVEIALNVDEFSIDEYIEKTQQQEILTAARKTDSKQLKQIRSMVTKANYFEIRLVLAKYGAKQWN